MAPFVIPGIVLAIGFYAAYAPPPLALYGTALILILAFTTRFLPIAYANAQRGDAQHQSGDGGGGAHPGRRPADGDPPGRGAAAQAQPARAPGCWSSSRRRASCPPRSSCSARTRRCISVLLFDLSEEGNFEVLAALGVILLVRHPVARLRSASSALGPRLHAAADRDMSKLVLRERRASASATSTAVDDFDLDAAARASSSRCSGPSGCGKTTTLRMIAGFIDADAPARSRWTAR